MKTIYQLPLYLILISTARAEQGAGDNPRLFNGRFSQRELIAVVLRDNQTLKAAVAKWETMKARVPQARAWEDLRAGVDWRTERSVPMVPNNH